MALFHGKIGWKGQRKRENKFKKLKITIMASFQAKISWKILRK